jgi:hypothetical protein
MIGIILYWAALTLIVWWICGVLAIALAVATSEPYENISPLFKKRCMFLGPIALAVGTIVEILIPLSQYPVKLGARLGSYVGDKIAAFIRRRAF